RLACVHTVHHFQAGQTAVADFGALQALRDDADHFATGIERRVGDHTHQADGAAAVDQANASLGQVLTQRFGGFAVDRAGAGAGSTEDADATQGHGRTPWLNAPRVTSRY